MTDLVYLAVGLVVGGGLGCLIGWLLGRGRALPADQSLVGELRGQLSIREQELQRVRDDLATAMAGRAAAEASDKAARALLAELQRAHERAREESRTAQEKALEELRTSFKALSVDALRELQPHLIERVAETVAKLQEGAKGDLAQRQQAIATLVEPLKQQLEQYQARLQQSENQQSAALGEVKTQLEHLAHHSQTLALETQQFRGILKSNLARGRWGEETLRRVVESAGMSAHCDFSEQSQSGDSKPDLLVRLPGERLIIVDAKVPDLEFLARLEGAEPIRRIEALSGHAQKLRNTIKALADRNYPAEFPRSLDYVVLFLPAESLFSAALEGDPELIVWAAKRKILLATPASLIGLLRSVSVSWREHAQSMNAQRIAEAAGDLYDRVVTFATHLEAIRAGIQKAASAYNDASASFQARVRPAGERLISLGSASADEKPLPRVEPLAQGMRLPPTVAN